MKVLGRMWKESGIIKNTRCRLVFGVELLLLVIGMAGLFGPDGIVAGKDSTALLLGEGIPLKAGVYEAKLFYQAEGDGTHSFGVEAEDAYFRGLLSNSVTLFADSGEAVCQFYLKEGVEHLKICVEGQEDSLEIRGVEITASPAGSRAFIFLALFFSLLINAMMMVYLYHRRQPFDRTAQAVMAGLLLVVLCASLPLTVDYIIEVEGIAGLLAAIERVSRNPMELVELENIFFIAPAALRRVGFSMSLTYRLYVFIVNILTAVTAYACFRRIFRDRLGGLALSVLYSLNPLRIACIYKRAALGEYTIMIVIPLLAYGAYRLCRAGKPGGGKGDAAPQKRNDESKADKSKADESKEDESKAADESKADERSGGNRKRIMQLACVIAIALCFLGATYQTNEILVSGRPLWVYSMSDMENAQLRGLEYLPGQTYGIEE